MHTVLTDDGVGGGGKATNEDWEIVLAAIELRCKLLITNYKKEDVEVQLQKIDFKTKVVICDTRAGSHSILINGRNGDWYYGFDPDWSLVKKQKLRDGEYEIFPKVNKNLAGRVNIRVHKGHLLNKIFSKNRPFAMGCTIQKKYHSDSEEMIKLAVMKRRNITECSLLICDLIDKFHKHELIFL